MKTTLFLLLLSFMCGCGNREIEYFPSTGRYYPKYNGMFIYKFTYGEYGLYLTPPAIFADDSAGAVKLLNEYLETKSVGTKIIKLP